MEAVDFKRVDSITRAGKPTHYYLLDGVRIAGVTTILNGFVPKPMLINWAVKEAGIWAEKNIALLNESPENIALNIKNNALNKRDESAKSGTDKHLILEQILKGGKVEVAQEYSADIRQLIAWLNVFKPKIIFSEGEHVHTGLRYAGTSDLICEIAGETWLIDLKTGKGIYNEVALQLSAYENSTHVVNSSGALELMPKIDKLGVLHLYQGHLRFLEVKRDARYWDLFQNGLYFFNWNKNSPDKIFKEI